MQNTHIRLLDPAEPHTAELVGLALGIRRHLVYLYRRKSSRRLTDGAGQRVPLLSAPPQRENLAGNRSRHADIKRYPCATDVEDIEESMIGHEENHDRFHINPM